MKPMRRLRILVADQDAAMCQEYQEVLPPLGHEVLEIVPTGRALVARCAALCPDLVIADVQLPELDGIAAAGEICRDEPIPVIVATAQHNRELLGRAAEGHVLAYLIKPVGAAQLEAAIVMAMARFDEYRVLRQETATLRQALEDRKVIERAKGMLMKRAGLDEETAFRRLQQLSRNHNRKLVETARMILLADEALQPGEGLVTDPERRPAS